MRSTLLLALLLPGIVFAQTPLGPDAPEVSIGYEQGAGFTFTLSNPVGSNNAQEAYIEEIVPSNGMADPYWRFQGYAILQFATPADANDSVHIVMRDPQRARPVMIVDLNDGVDQAAFVPRPYVAADCTPMTWYLLDQGIPSELLVPLDTWTVQPHLPDQEYCFAVVAFAHNAEHVDAFCGIADALLFSERTPTGALQAYCVVGDQVGVQETAFARTVLAPVPADEGMRVQGLPPNGARVRCLDALGNVVYDEALRNGDELITASWSAGTYLVQLTAADGSRLLQRMVVQH